MSIRGTIVWILAALLLATTGCSPPRGIYHTVERGQTLYQISRTYDQDAGDLARVNRIDDPTRLQVGTRLFISGATARRRVPSTLAEAPPAQASKPAPKTIRRVQPPVPSKPAETGAVAVSAPKFIWPLKGEVVRKFSSDGTPPSKGIEIAAAAGSEVVAAAPGQVIYSGDGITSFGNLIIIKHADGFYSVYGFNRKNLVKSGAFVGQGDRVALSGAAPNGGSSRLYFEIRNGKAAVNPIFFLP